MNANIINTGTALQLGSIAMDIARKGKGHACPVFKSLKELAHADFSAALNRQAANFRAERDRDRASAAAYRAAGGRF